MAMVSDAGFPSGQSTLRHRPLSCAKTGIIAAAVTTRATVNSIMAEDRDEDHIVKAVMGMSVESVGVTPGGEAEACLVATVGGADIRVVPFPVVDTAASKVASRRMCRPHSRPSSRRSTGSTRRQWVRPRR